MSQKYFNYFSESERSSVKKFVKFRDSMLKPVLKLFETFKITPDSLSLSSLVVMGGFVYFIDKNTYYALAFVVGHIILDGLDGSLARYKNSASNKGAILDIVIDQMAMVIGILTLIYHSMTDPFWGALYMVSYIVMIAFLVALNAFDSPVKYIIRTKYFLFLVLFIDSYFETELLLPFLMTFSIYMTIASTCLICKFRKAVQK